MAVASSSNAVLDSGLVVGGIQILVGSTSATVIGASKISAVKGSLFINTGGTTTNNRIYVNSDGASTWTSLTTAA
jgi:hypothetical protein